jgi:ASC-1-like (ASCH) protein
MYDAVEFELHVQEPYFTQLRAGTKKVEGRLAAGNYNRIAEGSLLLFNKCLLLNVQAIRKYASFSEMLQAEMISEVLPGISSIEQGVGVYRKFYTEEKESFYGVLAISVSKPTAQPYIIMTELLAVRATFLGSMRIIIFLPEHFLYKYSNKYYTKLVGFSKTFHALFIMCLQFLL